ncbi:SET domain-containing protein [Sediminibacterium soli]|uniref:SET domain-containing protein n=1 Tax=Sediminibacterium soli TaxID=2698829 RepID=UPI00137A3D8A|nr:SET domain-containing protein-lysine N-methyltransferase [Sediminibacterium soli]NCI48266.1 SET domain-containing protein-lysine N-methyltransferase [Sediminibacterium soli]
MTKASLLHELQHEMYIALQPSPVHGIGVFALCGIPKGCRNIFSKDTGEWIRVGFEDVASLPEHSRNYIETYYLYDETHYFIPAQGCKVMDMASYLNHSATPNIISIEEGKYFETLRDICKGEELLVDYGSIADVVGYEK